MKMRGRPSSERTVTTIMWGGDPDLRERRWRVFPRKRKKEKKKKENRRVGRMTGMGMTGVGRGRGGLRWGGGEMV